MKKEEKIIIDFMYSFVDSNWSNINKIKCEIKKSKIKFLEEIKTDVQTAMWVLTEVCQWGMDKVYLKELYVDLFATNQEDCDFEVLKFGNKYIKIKFIHEEGEYEINFCEPKTKTVIYFD